MTTLDEIETRLDSLKPDELWDDVALLIRAVRQLGVIAVGLDETIDYVWRDEVDPDVLELINE
jgi:hypothetical protein